MKTKTKTSLRVAFAPSAELPPELVRCERSATESDLAALPVMTRSLTIERRERAEGETQDPLPTLAMSSETPVLRWGWYEILDHSPECVIMDRAKRGLPLLLNHWADEHVGRVDQVRIDEDRVMRGEPRFSRKQLGQDAETDLRDGIITDCSIGYRIHELVLEKQGKDGEYPTYRATKWEPLENSLTPVPADHTVGAGRSAVEGNRPSIRVLDTPSAAKATETDMDPEKVDAARKDGLNKAVEIRTLATRHGYPVEKIDDLIRSDVSLESASLAILGHLDEQRKLPAPAPIVDLTDKERQRYSVSRAIMGQIDGSGVEAGFEREIHEELAKRMPGEYKGKGGVLVPLQTRAGLDSVTATKGQELKFTQAGELIDLLRPQLKLTALGARMLLGLTGPVSFPRQTAGATGSWVGENPGADVTDTNLLLELVTLAMKTYQSSTSFSRQLLVSALSASVDAEQMVREDLTLDIAHSLERAGIQGLGSSNQPRGVLNTSGIGVVAIGANGGAPTFAHIVDLETMIAEANGDVGELAYLTTPGMRGKLKKTAIEAGDAQKVWTGQAGNPGLGEMNGYAAHATTNVPSNLVKGASGAVCHAIILAAWRELIGGMWGAVELIVDPLRLKKQGMIEVTSFTVADWIVRRPASFAAVKDATTA